MKEMTQTNQTEIIGHGAIAQALEGIDKPFLFFASGVANSHETNEAEYKREYDLLMKQDTRKHLVYFTSLVVFTDPARRYSQHKAEMEEIIKVVFPSYSIIRVGNPAWATNPNQLVPFIRQKLESGTPFDVYDEYRHYLTKDEFRYWVNLIPEDRNSEMMITGERMKVKDLIERVKNDFNIR